MSKHDEFIDGIIQAALPKLKTAAVKERLNFITFALYYDHESPALSVCADTLENSDKAIRSMNSFSYKYFKEEVANGDLQAASSWSSLTGRSMMLGDFV